MMALFNTHTQHDHDYNMSAFVLIFQMVQDPTQFDVLVMPNLYGDILR